MQTHEFCMRKSDLVKEMFLAWVSCGTHTPTRCQAFDRCCAGDGGWWRLACLCKPRKNASASNTWSSCHTWWISCLVCQRTSPRPSSEPRSSLTDRRHMWSEFVGCGSSKLPVDCSGVQCRSVAWQRPWWWMCSKTRLLGSRPRALVPSVMPCIEFRRLWAEIWKAAVKLDLITYSTSVKRYCFEGDIDRALRIMVDMMGLESFAPDEIMYNPIFDDCAKLQPVVEGLRLLDEMREACIAPSSYTVSGSAWWTTWKLRMVSLSEAAKNSSGASRVVPGRANCPSVKAVREGCHLCQQALIGVNSAPVDNSRSRMSDRQGRVLRSRESAGKALHTCRFCRAPNHTHSLWPSHSLSLSVCFQ